MVRWNLAQNAPASAFAITIWLLCFCLSGVAQQRITGQVLNVDHGPVEGASVIIKGTNSGTITAANGSFSISGKPGDILIISSVGMVKKEVVIHQEKNLTIVLSFTTNNMDDVLVVGYGRLKKSNMSGAVARVVAKDFNKGVVTNPMQQVQGKVAGLVIVQPGGDPNGELTVRLRGATSLEGQPPLLVINGVAIDDFNKAVATLNPVDIESFDVLKDAAAAAIYGSRGANGVILITTKAGVAGKTSVDYNGFISQEKFAHQLDVLSADQWRKATAAMNAGSLDAGANMDWQKAITHTGYSHSHSIAVSTGTDQLNLRGSVGYINQNGIVLNSGKEVVTGRITALQKSLDNRLDIRYDINASTIKRDLLPDQFSTSQSRLGGSGIFDIALRYLSVWPAYNPDGTYYRPPASAPNPLFILKEVYSKQNENFFQGSFKADYELFKGLTVGTLGALSRANDINDKFFPAIPGSNGTAQASKFNFNKQNLSVDFHGNYHRTFQKHELDLTGVYEYNRYLNDDFGVTARGFLVPEILNNNLAAATDITNRDIFSHKTEVKLVSFLGRAVYNFDNRYIVTANFRRDGSSKFGIHNRWGNFPSIAVAWRATSESFLKENKWLNNLKLRVSYGLTGNQENLLPNSYQLLYGIAGPYLYNGQVYQGYAVTQENNPDLKWEVRKSFNVGIDFSVFNNRLNGTIDLFEDHTSDILFQYDLPQPPFLTSVVTANAASAINKGIEANVNARILTNNFQWSVNTNFSTLQNKITNLSGRFRGTDLSITNRHYGYAEGSGLSGAYISQLQVGYPAGVFWLPQHAGLDADGHELFNNFDVNGKLIGVSTNYSDQDRIFVSPVPDFTWAFGNDFSYKNIGLVFLARGVQGQKVFANSLLNLDGKVYLPANNVAPGALTNGFTDQPVPSTYWLRDASFTRLENITLSYKFKLPGSTNNIRCYLTAINLFVITSYNGIDPEIKTEGSQRYIDRNYYPRSRGCRFGLSVVF